MPLCAQCGEALPPRAPRGPARRYCSPGCRVAAFRERQVIEWPARDVDELEVVRTRREDLVAAAEAILGDVATRPPEDRLTAAVLEAGVLGSELVDVARVLPHGLAWRAAGLGGHLRDGLERYFPREDGPNDDPAA